MKLLQQISEILSHWIDCVAETLLALRRRLAASHTLHLIEGADNSFRFQPAEGAPHQGDTTRVRIVNGELAGPVPEVLRAQARGNRIAVILQPGRFMFRPLELPRRASEFLGGIVRAQIDRLTPWSAEDAAFGWGEPTEIDNDRIVVTVAAAARASVAPFALALAGLGAGSITVSTTAPVEQAGGGPIKVYEQTGRARLEIQRLRRLLVGMLLLAGLTAAAAMAADEMIGARLQTRQDDVAHRIATGEAAMRARLNGSRDSLVASLERRKQQTPASVIVLEALSRIFPDDTYVTELRIAGNKMQVVGITRDAPALIRLIAQSSYFAQASFFAPTTRMPSQVGENFHIEAQVLPVFTPPT